MHLHGKIGCAAFVSTAALQFALHKLNSGTAWDILWNSAAAGLLSFVIAFKVCQPSVMPVVWRSQLLASLFMWATLVVCQPLSLYTCFGWYVSFMAFFHFSEFLVTSLIRPQKLSTDSFLLNHSKAYAIAASVSWLEYLLELWLFPSLKEMSWIHMAGIFLCAGGELLRKVAMLTAGSNFDHLIRISRENEHQLVTSGIYGFCRHPSYVGWFYWSVGTQLLLCNPLCIVAYTLVSWKFFHERIFEEEMTLLHFFGEDYEEYQNKVSTGLPFIKGYVI